MDLESRGVPSEIIGEVIRAESQERGSGAEIRQILKLMRKRRFDPQNATWEEKNKMKAFLYRKGYDQSSVRAAMEVESLDSDRFSV
jgi:regulatory protein